MKETMNDNDKIKVIFLGTGTSIGVPVIGCDCRVCKSADKRDKRFRTSIYLEYKGVSLVVDTGPDFRIQMLRENIENIDAVLFTHAHRDHIAGLDDIRAFNYVLNKRIDIYGAERVIESIRTEFPYIFSESRYFGAPQLNVNIIESEPFMINNLEICPINLMHDKLPIFGYRFGDFVYITDGSAITEEEIEKCRGAKVLVINALRNSRHVSHFSLQEAIDVVNKIQPEKAYLTHMSHFIGLQSEMESNLPENIRPAYDGLRIEII